jgi:hypothetical protein
MLTYADVISLTYADVWRRMATYGDVWRRMVTSMGSSRRSPIDKATAQDDDPADAGGVCVCVARSILTYPRLCSRMLTYAHVYWRMLAYAGVSWRMLRYDDVL